MRVAPPGEQPSGLDIAPDQPGLVRRRAAARQRRDPRRARPWKAALEDVRVPDKQLPVAARRPNDPAGTHGVRTLVTTERDGECFDLRSLAVGRAYRGADVPEGVPALYQHQPSTTVVDQPDVSGPTWVAGSGRDLESPVETGLLGDPQDEFLDRQVAGIRGRVGGVPPELHPHRPIERLGKCEPNVERRALAFPAFELAETRTLDPDAMGQGGLREPSAAPARPDVAAELGCGAGG